MPLPTRPQRYCDPASLFFSQWHLPLVLFLCICICISVSVSLPSTHLPFLSRCRLSLVLCLRLCLFVASVFVFACVCSFFPDGICLQSFVSVFLFLVACYATLHPALSIRPSIGRLVTFYFFYDFYFFTSLLLPKWSSDLKYGSCPPACDWSSLVDFQIGFTGCN